MLCLKEDKLKPLHPEKAKVPGIKNGEQTWWAGQYTEVRVTATSSVPSLGGRAQMFLAQGGHLRPRQTPDSSETPPLASQ